ncbi:MAG TPA: response regulator [Xanthobacteraceae bacterium]|nr:response regulator [Xanthobacteraceae bacterium]
MESRATQIARLVERLKVLVVDDEPSMRKVVRALLQTLGIKEIYEAAEGNDGLNKIRIRAPDLVILDWEMPRPNGPDFMRALRSPETFPFPDVPVIMLTGYSERSRVVEAMQLGVHEFLLKPVSSTSLLARIVSILVHPRPMVRRGDYYGPAPRPPLNRRPDFAVDTTEYCLL